MTMTGSQFRFKWSSRDSFRGDKTLLAMPEPHLDNQQSTTSINTSQRRFQWSSISIYYIKELNPLRMVVLASNSRPGRSPTLQNKTISLQLQIQLNPSFKRGNDHHLHHCIALGFDNQTRSSVRFEWWSWDRINQYFSLSDHERRDGLTERRAR